MKWWRSLNNGQRITFGAGLAAILIGSMFLIYWFWPKTYVPLFVDLQPHDSAALVAQLETLGADYRVDPDTAVITVPQQQRDVLRMKLLEKGVPFRSALGFELFDNAGFGATEFSQKINYQRALEGELARTVMALDPVRYARLHLVLPESSLFKRDREQPKASVTVITAPGKSLTGGQITGIQMLVSSAVPGLTADAVSVHDHRGINLSGAGAAGSLAGNGAIESRLRAKETVESYLTAKVYEILAPIYPASSIAISIDATLRLDHVTSTREAIYPADKDRNGGLHDTKQLDQIDELPGAIERLSVGVMLPGSGSDVSMEQIRELVTSAIGADPARGDRIAIFPVLRAGAGNDGKGSVLGLDSKLRNPPGAGAGVEPAAADASPVSGWRELPSLLWIGVLGIAAILFGLIYAISLRRSDRMSQAEREVLLGNVREWLREPRSSGNPVE